jgi:hypothetical protein
VTQEQRTPEEFAKLRREWNPIYTEGKVIHDLVDQVERLQRYAMEITNGTTEEGIYCGRCPRELYQEIVNAE